MTPAISLAQVTELQSGAWVEEPFVAVVDRIERKEVKKTGKPFWVLKLSDTTGSATAEASMFTAPKFSEGDQIEVSGKGVKFEQNQYGNKVSWGDKATVVVVQHTPPSRAPATSNPPPSPYDESQRPPPSTQLPEEVAAIKHAKFHLKMKKLALLRLQCFDYAQQVIGKACKAGFISFRDGDESTRAEMVGTVSSGLFIETCRRGIDDIVAPLGPPARPQQPAPANPPAQPQRAAQPPPANPAPHNNPSRFPADNPEGHAFPPGSMVDEDVPF